MKYFVISVYQNLNGVRVRYYAFNREYGLHLTTDPNDPEILYYNSKAEAMAQRATSCDCVLSICEEYIGKIGHE